MSTARRALAFWLLAAACALTFYALDARFFLTGRDDLELLRRGAKLAFVGVLALLVGSRARADRRLAVAFALVLIGDTLFFLRLAMPAVAAFLAAQVALIWRNGRGLPAYLRGGAWRARRRRVALLSAGCIALVVAAVTGIAVATRLPLSLGRLALGIAYALFLAASLWIAWLAPLVGALQRPRRVTAAMTLFFFCDITVGLGGLLPDRGALMARMLTWVFYVPALALLAASGEKEG